MNGACNSTKNWPLGPGGGVEHHQISITKTTDFSFRRLGHAPGAGLGSTWGQKLERGYLRWCHIDCSF